MAERKKLVKSSKKSSISKVEIITVTSNDVALLTARHPVGVVVAEKRNQSEIFNSEQKPKPVIISGCPLPQVLPPEYQAATDIAFKKDKSKNNSKAKMFRPRKYVKQKLLRKPPIDHGVETDRGYNPQNYITPSQEFKFLGQSHTLQSGDGNTTGIYTDENTYAATLLSGPPHYVVVSKGMRDEADPGFANNILVHNNFPIPCHSENSSMPSGSEELNSSEGKEATISSGKKSGLKNISKGYNKASFIAIANEISTSDTICDDDIISSETSYENVSKKVLKPNVPKVIPVKRGGLHIRQIPHVIGKTSRDFNSKILKSRGTARSMHYGKIKKIIRINESEMENKGVTYSGDSRTGIYHGASGNAASTEKAFLIF